MANESLQARCGSFRYTEFRAMPVATHAFYLENVGMVRLYCSYIIVFLVGSCQLFR